MIRKIFGFILVFFGILGLFLPVLQGTLMVVAGLTILGVIGKKAHYHYNHHYAKSRYLQKRKK